jgi:hypothetical protein
MPPYAEIEVDQTELLSSGQMMRRPRSLRGRRRAPRRSFVSRHGGKAVLALLALAGVALAVNVRWLGLPAAVEHVLALAGWGVAAALGSAVLVASVRTLLPERISDADQETAAWLRALVSEGTWWEDPSTDGWLPPAAAAVELHSSASAHSEQFPDADASSAVVADLRAQVDSLQAAVDWQAAELLTAQRILEKEREEARADERFRVLVALRAMRRLATAAPASQSVREFAARMEVVVARLDSPWTAGRPVPPLPSERLLIRQSSIPESPVADLPVSPVPPVTSDMSNVPVTPDVRAAVDAPVAPEATAPALAGVEELPGRSVADRGEIISPPVHHRMGASARGMVDRRGLVAWLRDRASQHARRLASVPQPDSPTRL